MGTNPAELGADARRERILQLLGSQGRVKVAALAAFFQTSEVTIRHDLAELEGRGLLARVHGGAESTRRAYYTLSLSERMKQNEQAKRAVAAAAAMQIRSGDTVILDSGTTTLMVAQELRDKKGITALTNSLPIASELSNSADANVILLGGSLNPKNLFVYGDDTAAQLKKYKADVMVMAVDGISAQFGVTTYHHLEAQVTRRMCERAEKVIAAADFTKVGREGFAKVCDIAMVDVLVTNLEADAASAGAIAAAGVEVIGV